MACRARCRRAWGCCRRRRCGRFPLPPPGIDRASRMNVLVTGGTGFLGGYVMAALEAAGHAPIAYDIAPPAPEMLAVAPLAARFRAGQTTDIARLFEICRTERIDAIVHAAGIVGLETSL